MKTKKRFQGDFGEEIACKFLIEKGHGILDRNYNKYSGEIDIVSCENNTIHFVEVKTAFVPRNNVSRENFIRPEEHVTRSKIRKIEKTALAYLEEKDLEHMAWCLDVIAVYVFQRTEKGIKVKGKNQYIFKTVYLPNVY